MPRPFPTEFRLRSVALVRAGKLITTVTVELGISAAAIHNWVRQEQIDCGERPGITAPENVELSKAMKRIRQLEEEVKILKLASETLRGRQTEPKRIHLDVDALVETGHRAKLCRRSLGVSSPGYFKYRKRPLSPTQMCRNG
jgi:transposase